jgi:ABC-type transporter Mla MlaB component
MCWPGNGKGDSMENRPPAGTTRFYFKLDGKMTYEFYRELEERVANAIRRDQSLEIDLSEVVEIDLCGLHLIGVLQSAGVIVATSPVVEKASRRLLETLNSAALGRVKRRQGAAIAITTLSSTSK